METRQIYFKKEKLDGVLFILEVLIPNDCKIFIGSWNLIKPRGGSDVYRVDIESIDTKTWTKLKQLYFKNKCAKRALPNCIHLY